jgi:hypothetical protein
VLTKEQQTKKQRTSLLKAPSAHSLRKELSKEYAFLRNDFKRK